jgi:hypothetical protein
MVRADVLTHEAFQMALIEHDYMIEQVPAAVTDPAVDNTVLPRTLKAGLLGLDAQCLDRVDYLSMTSLFRAATTLERSAKLIQSFERPGKSVPVRMLVLGLRIAYSHYILDPQMR